jgi:hypothetical protein
LQIAVDRQDLWAKKHTVHKTILTKSLLSRKKWLGNEKLLRKTFFVLGSTCQIFVRAEYSAENIFGRSLVMRHWRIALHSFLHSFFFLQRFHAGGQCSPEPTLYLKAAAADAIQGCQIRMVVRRSEKYQIDLVE